MAKETVFPKGLRIRFRGTYDYDGLIELLNSFYDRTNIDNEYPKFKYKVLPTGAEVDFKYLGDRKVDQYISLFLTIEGKAFDMVRTPTMVNGVEKMMSGGKIELTFTAEYFLDWNGIFSDKKYHHPKIKKEVLKKMENFLGEKFEGIAYEDFKYLGKIDIHKLVCKFHKETKEFLGMECV